MAESKYGKYIVTELKAPMSGEAAARYAQFATRILWMDDNVVEGSFQLGCSWYLRPPANQMSTGHKHDADEIIAFFGSNPDDPHDLGGEIEFWIEDEQHILTKSALIFIPAGMKHCPLILRRVDRPILHFTTVTTGKYEAIREE